MNTGASWRERASWCLFDFANSAFVTIMITAFYGRFFMDVIAKGHAPSTLWGVCMAAAMIIVAVSSPVLAAVADRSASKRAMLRAYVIINVVACVALAWVRPGMSFAIPLAMALIVVADVAFEGAYVFYNAFLAELVSIDRAGRLSGYGWAIGYAGGLGCLALINHVGWIPEHYDAQSVQRALYVPIAVGLWFALFSLPMLTLVRERALPKPSEAGYVQQALRDVRSSIRYVRGNRDLLRFFIAYVLFTDGLETVIMFTGKFTGDALGFTPSDTIKLFLVLNVVAAPGAIVFGYLVDRIGSVRSVAITLVIWLVVVAGSILVQTKLQFWPIACAAAIGLGATQSASRSVVVRMVPQEHTTRVFGLMTVVGRASAIVGPIVYGVVADVTGNARIAVGTVGLFFVAGLVLLRGIDEKRAAQARGG